MSNTFLSPGCATHILCVGGGDAHTVWWCSLFGPAVIGRGYLADMEKVLPIRVDLSAWALGAALVLPVGIVPGAVEEATMTPAL